MVHLPELVLALDSSPFDELECDFRSNLCRWTSDDVITYDAYGHPGQSDGPLLKYASNVSTGPIRLQPDEPNDSWQIESTIRLDLLRSDSKVEQSEQDACIQAHVYGLTNTLDAYLVFEVRQKAENEWRPLVRLQDQLYKDRWHSLHLLIPAKTLQLRFVSNLDSIYLGEIRLAADPTACDQSEVCDFEEDIHCSAFSQPIDSSNFERISPKSSDRSLYPPLDSTLNSEHGHYLTIKRTDQFEAYRQPMLRIEPQNGFVLRARLYYPKQSQDRIRFVLQPLNDTTVEAQDVAPTVWDTDTWQAPALDSWQTIRMYVTTQQPAQLTLCYSRLDLGSPVLAIDDVRFEIMSSPMQPADCAFDGSFCRYASEAESNVHWQIGVGRLTNVKSVHEFDAPEPEPGHMYAYVDTTNIPSTYSMRNSSINKYSARLQSDPVPIVGQFCVHMQINVQMRLVSTATFRLATRSVHTLSNSLIEPLASFSFSNEHSEWMSIEMPGRSYGHFQVLFDFDFTLNANHFWRPFVAIRRVRVEQNQCDATALESQTIVEKSASPNFLNLNCEFDATLCKWTNQLMDKFKLSTKSLQSARQPPIDHNEGNYIEVIDNDAFVIPKLESKSQLEVNANSD